MSVALKEGLLLEILHRNKQRNELRFCFSSCCDTVQPFQSGPC